MLVAYPGHQVFGDRRVWQVRNGHVLQQLLVWRPAKILQGLLPNAVVIAKSELHRRHLESPHLLRREAEASRLGIEPDLLVPALRLPDLLRQALDSPLN